MLSMEADVRYCMLAIFSFGCTEYSIGDTKQDVAADTGRDERNALEVMPRALDFGTVNVGDQAETNITLTNLGDRSFVVGATGLPDDNGVFHVGLEGVLELAPGEAHVVSASFTPEYGGDFIGSVLFHADRDDVAAEQVQLAGRTPLGDIVIEPDTYDFGSVITGSRESMILSVRNAGEGPLSITSVDYVSTDSRWLFLSESSILEGETLSAGERREVEVTFAPDEVGGWEGQLEIVSNDPDTPQAIAVQSGLATCECPDGWIPSSTAAECVRRFEIPAAFQGEPEHVCPSPTQVTYGMLGARYPDDFIVQDAHWGQDDGVSNGRMNDVGIWACDPGDVLAGQRPFDEWVGFQVCLDLPDTATYITGIGADNYGRLVVDGLTVWEKIGDDLENFNYWWMIPIELTAGDHVVELWGLNTGSKASLGVELYGPFDPSKVSDGPSMHALPLADSVVWSTREAVGATFQVGEDNGWYCPDARMTLSLCEPEPVCFIHERTDCSG